MSLLTTFTDHNTFVNRHNGPTLEQQQTMLAAIGVDSLDQLIDQTVPANIRLPQPLQLPKAINEEMLLQQLKHIAQRILLTKAISAKVTTTLIPQVLFYAISSKIPDGIPPIPLSARNISRSIRILT